MVYTEDLKSSALNRLAGSSPALGTTPVLFGRQVG